MIQVSTFNILIAVGIVLMLYSVIDDRNRIYANMVAAFSSGLIFVYAGTAVAIGAVASGTSASLGDLLKFIGLIMFVYTMIMGYEIIDEAIRIKKAGLAEDESDENL